MKLTLIDPFSNANLLASEGKGHGCRVLQVGHHHRGDGEHETRHDLLRVVVILRVGERYTGTVDSNPAAPLGASRK